MSGFKVKLEGLEQFKSSLKKVSNIKTLLPDITLGVLQIHNTLEKRVNDIYNVPAQLSTVLIGNSVKPAELGNTFIRFSLQYRYKSIELSKYPVSQDISKSGKLSSAPLRMPDGGIKWVKGHWSRVTKVEIRKGSRVIARKSKYSKFKGFYVNGHVVSRDQQATWTKYPTRGFLGIRAPISILYGPSLSQLAEKVYNTDTEVKNSVNNFENVIINSFVKYYGAS